MDRPQTANGGQTSTPEPTAAPTDGSAEDSLAADTFAVDPFDPNPFATDVLAEQVRAWEEAQGLGASTLGLPVVTGSPLERELAGELDAVRQRLAYYERFDSLINDSVQRSADLFQALFAEREHQRRAGVALAAEVESAASAAAERQLAVERQTMHETLMALMVEAGRLQRGVDSLIQQIAEAVTDLTSRGDSPYDTQFDVPGPGA